MQEAYPFPTAQDQIRNYDRRRAFIQKAGSCSSPMAHCPTFDEDTVTSGRISGTIPQDLMPSVQSPPADLAQLGALPLFSPSEYSQQSESNTHHLDRNDLDMSLAFAPVSIELPTPPQDGPLRLPSFDRLGIANPHPNRIASASHDIQNLPLDKVLMHHQDGDIDMQDGGQTDRLYGFGFGADHNKSRNRPGPFIMPAMPSILTPPDESALFDWGTRFSMSSQNDDLHRFSAATQANTAESRPGTILPTSNETTAVSVNTESAQVSEHSVLSVQDQEAITEIILSHLKTITLTRELKVLSHALPSPRIPGHAYPHIIERIRSRIPTSPLTWMSLLHAVPGRYNMSDLPISPPSTPGQALGTADDYFTTRVFSGAAVQSADYCAGDEAQMLNTTPTGNALAPPCTVNLCIVERHIPPTSSNEFKSLFNTNRPSLLVDRMIELVPGNGHLLFIYPTRAGAQEFCSSYLGPIVEPLMRQMLVVHGFSQDLIRSICTMPAANDMMPFETLKLKTEMLCDELRNTQDPRIMRRLYGSGGLFSLVYAEPHLMDLNRDVWSDWYVKQEKQRIREAVNREFRRSNRATASWEITPRSIVQEILVDVGGDRNSDGSGKQPRAYPLGSEPIGKKIEVGVFIIRREALP